MTFWFTLMSGLLIFFALGTVMSSNLIHSAFLMIGAFVAMAGLYVLLNADFLAMIQIWVYVGAIAVLMVFGIMLSRRGSPEESNPPNRYKWIALLTAVVMFGLLARSVLKTSFHVVPSATGSTVIQIANALLKDYMVAFEAIGILLLVAVVGAIIIGKDPK